MVVVQPFESLAEDRGEDYFAAGLTADLVTDLARFEALQVVAPRSRDWAAEDRLPGDPRGGAKRYLVGGSVRRAGGRIRVTARLEDLATGVQLWADRFDRPLDDLFAVQEELADRIAARLVSRLDQEGMRQARQRPPASLDAYDLCLRGRELHGRVTEAATLEARAMFDRAIALDPDYGLAHSWQAFTVHRGYTHWWGEPRGFAAVPPALALAERGVALAPESPFCVSTLGYVQYLAGAWEDAIANARAAVRINPAAYQARQTLSEVLMHACVDPDEAVRQSRIALDLDPFHPPSAQAQLGRALLLAGRVEEALAELRRCGPRLRDYGPYYTNLVVAAVETGRLEEARAAVAEVRRLRPGWTLRDMAGRWLFRDPAVAERFRAAYRAAGLPEE